MKVIKVISPQNLEIDEIPMPEIKNKDDVLIKIKLAGICGSDVHIYHGTSPVATYPRVIGHEIAGEVVETGTEATEFKTGDRVVMDPVVGCGKCYACTRGRANVCRSLKVRGVHLDGGYQEYMVLPKNGIYKVAPGLSWEETVLVEPFTVAAQVVARGEVAPRDTVFIMGAGPTGLTVLQVVKKIGARCLISDLVDTRLELARKMGADLVLNPSRQNVEAIIGEATEGNGPSVVIDAVCVPQSFEQAVALVAAGGRVVLLGFNEEPSRIAQFRITAKELDVKGSRLHSNKFPQVIDWFEHKTFDPTMIISHRYHFMDIREALEQVERYPSNTYKVILQFTDRA